MEELEISEDEAKKRLEERANRRKQINSLQ
jgi:hypothetical protein